MFLRDAATLAVATVPSPAAAPGAAPGAAPADLDLLGELQCPAPPSAVATLAPPAAASASTGGTGASGALSPSAALALALSSAPMAPTATLPQAGAAQKALQTSAYCACQDLDLLAAPKAPAPVPARREVQSCCYEYPGSHIREEKFCFAVKTRREFGGLFFSLFCTVLFGCAKFGCSSRPASGLPFAGLGMTSAPNAAPAAAPPTGRQKRADVTR